MNSISGKAPRSQIHHPQRPQMDKRIEQLKGHALLKEVATEVALGALSLAIAYPFAEDEQVAGDLKSRTITILTVNTFLRLASSLIQSASKIRARQNS